MNRADRFFAKVEPDGNGCLIWTGANAGNGYGRFLNFPAHRWLWERVIDVPEGLVADHLCRNPSCVRPSHIEFVTPRENVIRGIGPILQQARALARKACAHGHEWTPESTYMYDDKRGKRHRLCKLCAAEFRKTEASHAYHRRYARVFRINAALLAKHPRVCVTHGSQGPKVRVHVSTGDTAEDLDQARIEAVAAYRATLDQAKRAVA